MRRSVQDVITRARILSLVSTLEEGFPAGQLVGDIARFHLESALTREEVGLLRDDLEPGQHVSWQVEAMLALAWVLGLVAELGPRNPEAYGPVQERLMSDAAEGGLALRSDDEIRRMQGELEVIAARGEAPPPHQRYGAECLHWRRIALKWAMDDTMAWPSG